MRRAFAQVDVFASAPYSGNPVAVVLDGQRLSDEEMRSFAGWTNLSETTFVLPPTSAEADYRVRIFTPGEELPFAGHPTLGTCHAWLEAGGVPRGELVIQECAAGLIPIRRADSRLAFAAPPLTREGPVDEQHLQHLIAMLGVDDGAVLDAAWVDNGPGWVGLLLADAGQVLALEPRIEGDHKIGVAAVHSDGSLVVRAFFDVAGSTREDPVTGSLNASLAMWLIETGRIRAPYVAHQGAVLGRAGQVHVERTRDATIWVGGATLTCVRGTVELGGHEERDQD